MAPYTRNNPRRSGRVKQLDPVSYVQTRPYTRSVVVQGAPGKKAPAKKTPIKKATAKPPPAKKISAKESSSSDSDEESEVDEIQDGPVKKAPTKKVPAKKNPAKAALVKKNSSKRVKEESDSDEASRSDPTKKAAAKKSPPKKVKKEEPDSAKFLDDKEDNSAAPVKEAPATNVKFEESESSKDEIRDYSNLQPWESARSLDWWIMGTRCLLHRTLWWRGEGDDALMELMNVFDDQLDEVGDALADLPEDPFARHPSYTEMYFQLAMDPESPRAALEAEFRRRSMGDAVRIISVVGLRAMYLAWRDFAEEDGEVGDDRFLDGILDSFRLRMGFPLTD